MIEFEPHHDCEVGWAPCSCSIGAHYRNSHSSVSGHFEVVHGLVVRYAVVLGSCLLVLAELVELRSVVCFLLAGKSLGHQLAKNGLEQS